MNLNIKNEDKILVIAPHPDDETIGCGGLLAIYGKQCDILLLTDGRKGYLSGADVDEENLVKTRETELYNAAKIANVNKIIMLHIPDGTLMDHRENVMLFDITSYDLIFVPNRFERHKDHCIVSDMVWKMKRQQHAKALIYEYEVWSPISNPMCILDISNVISMKESMVLEYQSQIKYVDYKNMTLSLNRYRGACFKTEYAEVYSMMSHKSVLRVLYDKLPSGIKKAIRKLKHSMILKKQGETT